MEYPKFGNYMLDDPGCEETPYGEPSDSSKSFEGDEADEEVSE